jgi:hypothetical protein
MKLIFCRKCQDLFRLYSQVWRACSCGESGGRYTDGLMAEITGEAIPIGFKNDDFVRAIRHQPASGPGATFTAFVIPKECLTIQVIEKPWSPSR